MFCEMEWECWSVGMVKGGYLEQAGSAKRPALPAREAASDLLLRKASSGVKRARGAGEWVWVCPGVWATANTTLEDLKWLSVVLLGRGRV